MNDKGDDKNDYSLNCMNHNDNLKKKVNFPTVRRIITPLVHLVLSG